jgi:hypothetical protein
MASNEERKPKMTIERKKRKTISAIENGVNGENS